MTKTLTFIPVLTRLNCEIRFRPTLNSWQNVIIAASELEKEFPHWKLNDNKQSDIILFNPEEKVSTEICFNKIMYASEGTIDVSELNKQIDQAFSKVGPGSGVTEIQHVGYRNITVYKTKVLFHELTELMSDKYHNQEGINKLPFKTEDLMVSIDGKNEDQNMFNHLRMGPMHKDQAFSVFNSPYDQVNSLEKDVAYLFLDVDSYSSYHVDVKDVFDIRDKCISNNKELIESVLTTLGN